MPRPDGILKTVVQTVGRLADHVWPPMCANCDGIIDAPGLCPDCWDGISFIGAPQCDACGVPLPYGDAGHAICAACARRPPPFARARAAFVYDADSRPMILAFKHADRTDLAPVMTTLMRRPAGPLLADADLIAPVPLHWRRLFSRRYNQAAILARGLGADGYVGDLLVRTKFTPSQGGKSRAGRARNVANVFRVPDRHRPRLRDKRVLLVDDVYTTGATVSAATRALLRAGAASVDVLTLARVVQTQT